MVDVDGSPCAGIRVLIAGECEKLFHSTTVLSAADGTFTMDSAPAHDGALAALDERGAIMGIQPCDGANVTIRVIPAQVR